MLSEAVPSVIDLKVLQWPGRRGAAFPKRSRAQLKRQEKAPRRKATRKSELFLFLARERAHSKQNDEKEGTVERRQHTTEQSDMTSPIQTPASSSIGELPALPSSKEKQSKETMVRSVVGQHTKSMRKPEQDHEQTPPPTRTATRAAASEDQPSAQQSVSPPPPRQSQSTAISATQQQELKQLQSEQLSMTDRERKQALLDRLRGTYLADDDGIARHHKDDNTHHHQHHQHPQLLRTAIHRTVALDAKPRHGWLEYAVEFVPVDYCIDDLAVPGTYFEPRMNRHSVRLYINSDDKTQNNDDNGHSAQQQLLSNEDHTPCNNDPLSSSSSSSSWQPQRLWRDIYDSLCAATKLIYIVGWSVDHRQSLLRGAEQQEALQNYKNDSAGAYSPYLGELLKQKAAEGVRVNILVWDDRTSTACFFGWMKEGLMSTSDEALRLFCRDTGINVCLAPIAAKHKNPFVGMRNTFTSTHHQKMIVCDNPNNNSNHHQLVGYVGGVDLTGGRYEDCTYPLFRTLQSDHRDDFYNGCTAGVNAGTGPRQPWHDIHARVTGRVVLDLVQNFEERWQKQAPPYILDQLVDLEAAGIYVADDDNNNGGGEETLTKDEFESWSCQLFRSIDDRTAKFDPELKARTPLDFEKTEGIVPMPAPKVHGRRRSSIDKKTGQEKRRKRDRLLGKDYRPKLERFFVGENAIGFTFDRFLNRKGKVSKDASAQEAMVHHIRRAEHCVYIESQYFLSSAHFWTSDTSVKCGNLVAAETTLKICRKIEAGERFAAYILLPMWSEGIPESMAVQSILYWQYRTIESMYKRIASAIQRRKTWVKKNTGGEGFDAKPTDYLNFYCLGQRETEDGSQATIKPAANTQGEVLSQTRRHLIYVHSKMVIVDDAVALIGSANINQRSLDGSRDSEIVLGCWQEAHLADKKDFGRGDVHRFRLQCFAHTMGTMDDSFRNPSSLECVQRVNQIAQANWKTYTGSNVTDMHSYLLPYPIAVDCEDGSVTAATEDGCFPDTTAKILGSTTMLPEFLTT